MTLLECGAQRLDAVMTVMDDAFDPAFGEAWTLPQCSGLLIMPGVWMTLAMDGDTPAGFSVSRIVVDEAELLLLGVRQGARRQGVGGALLHEFCRAATERGASRLHLEMRDGNAALAMYVRAGFEQAGRRVKYYRGAGGEHYDALTLVRVASPSIL